METFTTREMDVWRETARGLGLRAIGRKLGICKATVAGVRKTLYCKLRVKNAVEAALSAVAHGVIEIPKVQPSPVVTPRGHPPRPRTRAK